MFGKRKIGSEMSFPYAMKTDFCQIFERDMNQLYLLSFLLTGDRTIAEQCFVGGLHIAQEENHVFKEWAESWARRAIIQNAIRMVRPRKASEDTGSRAISSPDHTLMKHVEIAGIVDLPAFDRFAFVMSVLERYSDKECSLLLGCSRDDVARARTRALERLGKSADVARRLASVDSNKAGQDNSEFGARLTAASTLAASA